MIELLGRLRDLAAADASVLQAGLSDAEAGRLRVAYAKDLEHAIACARTAAASISEGLGGGFTPGLGGGQVGSVDVDAVALELERRAAKRRDLADLEVALAAVLARWAEARVWLRG